MAMARMACIAQDAGVVATLGCESIRRLWSCCWPARTWLPVPSSGEGAGGVGGRKDIVTVHTFLEERGALGLLADPAFAAASDPVDPTLPRARIDEAARRRAAALADLCGRHAAGAAAGAEAGAGGGGGLTAAEVEACVLSFGDLHAYVGANQRPIDGIIRPLVAPPPPRPASSRAPRRGAVRRVDWPP